MESDDVPKRPAPLAAPDIGAMAGMAAGRDRLRVTRLAVAAVGVHRCLVLTSVLQGGTGFTTGSMAAGFAATAGWAGILLWDGWRRGRFRSGVAIGDVVIATCVGVVSATWPVEGMHLGYGLLQGAALVAGCALCGSARVASITVLVGVVGLWVAVPPPDDTTRRSPRSQRSRPDGSGPTPTECGLDAPATCPV